MNVKRLIVVLGLAGFIVMADNWVVSPLLPSIAHTLGIQPARAGILIAAYMLPFGLFQLLYGPLADRFGKLRVVGVSLVFFTVATGLCAAGVGLGDLTAYRALTGVFAAATMPVSLALIGDLVPMQQRQQAISGFMGIAFLGQATSMTIGGTIAAVTSWRGVFLTYAVVAAVITAVLLVTARSFAGELHGDPNSQFVRPYARLLGHSPSLRTYLVVFFEGLLVLASFSYLGALASHSLGLGTFEIGLLMAVFGIGVIAASRASARVAVRIGRNRLVAVGLSSYRRRRPGRGGRLNSTALGGARSPSPGTRLHVRALVTAHHRDAVRGEGTRHGDVAGCLRLHGRWRCRDGAWRPPHRGHQLPRVLLHGRCRFGGFERSRCVRSAKGRRSTSSAHAGEQGDAERPRVG